MMNTYEQRVKEFAYQIWESEGRPVGHEYRHWEMACKLAEGATNDDAEELALGSAHVVSVIAPEEPFNPDPKPEIDPAPPQPEQPTPPAHPNIPPHPNVPVDPIAPVETPPHISPTPPAQPIQPADPVQPGNPAQPIQPYATQAKPTKRTATVTTSVVNDDGKPQVVKNTTKPRKTRATKNQDSMSL